MLFIAIIITEKLKLFIQQKRLNFTFVIITKFAHCILYGLLNQPSTSQFNLTAVLNKHVLYNTRGTVAV